MDVEFHRCLNIALVNKSNARKILEIYLLGNKEAIRGRGNLNPKEVAKRTKIKHKKLLARMSIHKGNVLRVIASDDHVIEIHQSPTMS